MDGSSEWTLRGRRVVVGDEVRPAAVHVADGRIVAVTEPTRTSGAVEDVGDLVVLPGLVDPHVHVNDPGRTHWEGFPSATRAAAAGGTTTIVDMPLNCSPVTTTAAALETKRAAATGRCAIDVGFWGGVVPDNQPDLTDLVRAGVLGCKAFLVDSGLDEFPPVDRDRLLAAMPVLAAAGIPLLVHAELAEPMAAAQARFAALGPAAHRDHHRYVASRPPQAEDDAVQLVAELAETTGAAVHVLHLSSASALPILRAARGRGVSITVETCPHYLALADEDVPDGATEFKCAPPIRDRANNDALWDGLADGTIDLVASDHSPCSPELKARDEGDFAAAWGGISSLQLRLHVVWGAASRRGFDIVDVVGWLATAPARLAGLGQKGAIAPGNDADLVVFDPEPTWLVDPARLLHRHALTPYAGREVRGEVRATYLRGRLVYDGTAVDDGRGALLDRRTEAL